MKKLLVIGIILLFVGVSIAPTINFNTVKASQEDDLVEVTSQACGIQGYGNNTVKLTTKEVEEVKKLFDNLQNNIKDAKSKTEVRSLIHTAIEELNNNGLLPLGMSVSTAEELVMGEYLNKKMIHLLESITKKTESLNESNFFCITIGQIFNPILVTPINLISVPLLMIVLTLEIIHFFFGILYIPSLLLLYNSCFYLARMILHLSYLNPASIVLAGDFTGCNLSTLGVLGLKIFKGNMYGELYGYIGLKIMFDGIYDDDCYLLGFTVGIWTKDFNRIFNSIG